ncbi:MAG: lipoyl synthase [Planctomycetota bacterium]
MPPISLSHLVIDNEVAGDAFSKRRKPDWLRAKLPGGPGYRDTRSLVDRYALHTVCESAKCPNLGECWARGTATMMILGDVCTRSCGFCHIKTGRPPEYDLDEPRRVGEAAALMRLKHLVVTSVNRDELPDGGAEIWAETIREIRRHSPETSVEVLIPDFCGDWDALQLVLDERPEILNHNLETVPRMYKVVRPQAIYERSVELLRRAKAQGLTVKTGIMVGIGETDEEVLDLIDHVQSATRVPGVGSDAPARNQDPMAVPDPNRNLPPGAVLDRQITGVAKPEVGPKLRRGGSLVSQSTNPYWDHDAPVAAADSAERIAEVAYPAATYPGVHESADILTIGQYLQPTKNHLPISRWVTPDGFVEFKRYAEAAGFRHCESGPMVRSSYHAEEQVLQLDTPANA